MKALLLSMGYKLPGQERDAGGRDGDGEFLLDLNLDPIWGFLDFFSLSASYSTRSLHFACMKKILV